MSTAAQLARASGARLFRMSAVSGLVTGLSADGVIFAHRNPSAEVVQQLLELRVKGRTVSGFTSAQENAAAAHFVTAFDAASPANYAGGTDLSNPASNPAYVNLSVPLDSSYSYADPRTQSVLVTGNVRIATTAALTHPGTPVIKSQPFAWDNFSELATTASLNKGFFDILWRPSNGAETGMGSNAGFIVKLPIALGAGGTVRYDVEYIWAERW